MFRNAPRSGAASCPYSWAALSEAGKPPPYRSSWHNVATSWSPNQELITENTEKDEWCCKARWPSRPCDPMTRDDAASSAACCPRAETDAASSRARCQRTNYVRYYCSTILSALQPFLNVSCCLNTAMHSCANSHRASFRHFVRSTQTLLRAGRRTKYCGPRAAYVQRKPGSRELRAANDAL